MVDFRALCAELTGWIERSTRHYIRDPDVLIRARAALVDEPAAPAPPVDGEVAELTGQLIEAANGAAAMGWDQHAQRILRAVELLQQQALVPVSVGECPWEREGWCDELGRCWWGTPGFVNSYTVAQSAQWRLSTPDDRFGSELLCLPAHALPEVGE